MNRILVVDDDAAIRMLYAEELTEEGYEVITNEGDSQVMTIIKKKKPDVIIMDIRLGQQNGLDLLQDIRNTYYNLPVILCSAYSIHKYEPKSIAADYYVVKSSDLSELKNKIKWALESGIELPSEPNHSEKRGTKPISMEQTRLQW
jgi:DNA-binding response OmpR family regulator